MRLDVELIISFCVCMSLGQRTRQAVGLQLSLRQSCLCALWRKVQITGGVGHIG